MRKETNPDDVCGTCGAPWSEHLREPNGTAVCRLGPQVCAAIGKASPKVQFVPGLADAIRAGDPPHTNVHMPEDGKVRILSVERVRRATNRFRLSLIRVERVNVDTEPASGLLADRPEEENWQDLVVTVQDRAGNVFEVARVTCRHDGLVGESTAAGTLVQRISWDDALGDGLICPLCLDRGHGAGACPRR